jgi:endogenous inhibitor of DNA gyrase (YacG/DUF329 family)
MKKIQAPCPTCGKLVLWGPDTPWRPFCSERCRLIDLGDWLDESHRISEPLDEYQDNPLEQN